MKVLTKRADSYENQLILAFKSITFHICTWLSNATVLEIHVRLGFILVQTPSGCYSDRSIHPFQLRDACDGEL